MDIRKSSKLKTLKKGRLTKSRAVENSDDSSTEEKSDEESQNIGSRIRLFRDKRKNSKLSAKPRSEKSSAKSVDEKPENTIVEIESSVPAKSVQVAKESSLAQSIKKKFAFFRRSESVKSSTEDVEAAFVEKNEVQESESGQVLDVIVDVHHENEEQKNRIVKKNIFAKSLDDSGDSEDGGRTSSPENIPMKSLDSIEEFRDEKISSKKNLKTNLFDTDSEINRESEIDCLSSMDNDKVNDNSIDEQTSEFLPTSGGDSFRQRKRWEKLDVSAENLVEDLKKPQRRKWTKDSTSADIHKVIERKNSVPRKSVTANPEKSTRYKSIKTSTPIAAPRLKKKQDQNYQAFDNDGFLSDQDEVLRIETINNSSPKIKIGTKEVEKIDDSFSESENENKLTNKTKSKTEKVKEYSSITTESTENSDPKEQEQSSIERSESSDFIKRKSISRRRSSSKQLFLSEDNSINDKNEQDEIDDDEDEQDTVLNVMEKKSRKSSSSSKIDIIPSNFFEGKFTDDTTISTNEDMNTYEKESRRLRSKSKSKSSKSKKKDDPDNTSERSSRVKSKTTSSSTRNSMEEYLIRRRKAKSKTKKRQTDREKKHRENVEGNVKFTSVWIHRSEILEADYLTRHPMVKVHIVNIVTGEYLEPYNKEKNSSEILQPIITRMFDFKEKRSMIPVWEEELIFEQDFNDLLGEGKDSVLILFEVIDLLNFSDASACYDQFGRDACWYKIAWAFLRPVGITGIHHVEKKVRLQLYRPKKSFKKINQNKCEVYKWWKSSSRDKYPSSLYVTLLPVEPPKLEPLFYEQMLPFEDVGDAFDSSCQSPSSKVDPEVPKWRRSVTESCQIPNETFLEIEASENGCFHLAFSNDGKYLACALSEEYDYPIVVYKVHDGKIHARFSGHKNFIYSLSWSMDDRFLLSVSSDRTARFWDVQEKIIDHVQSLPHPSYVYCGKFSLEPSNFIVTGCYDRVARVWARLRSNGDEQYELVQELEVHESFVNSVCFQPNNEIFFTGDGVGVIVVWSARKTRRSPVRKEWQMMRKIKIKELEGVPINTIVMHPLGSKLLVHSRNNGLRLMDLLHGAVVKKFEGLTNPRIQITACISPCGKLLFCGGEDSTLNVWNLDSGRRLAVYEMEVQEKAVTCVDYHPYDHIVAFSIYGVPLPVKILKFDQEANGESVGLKSTTTVINAMSINSISKSKTQPVVVTNGGRYIRVLSNRSQNSSVNVNEFGSFGYLSPRHRDRDEVGVHGKGRMNKLVERNSNLKAKSINRLNGIIEKIDRILMYATNQRTDVDLESARDSSIFTISERQPYKFTQTFELENLAGEEQKRRSDKTSKKHRHRSRSERNSCSNIHKETEFSKAFSDSAAFNKKVSRFSDDSSTSNPSAFPKNFVIERLDLDKIDNDTESGFKDSLDTILDAKEDPTSEEILDIESLDSEDTYTVEKDKRSPDNGNNDFSDESNATFIIESEIPIPKPRKRVGKIEVM